MSSRNPINAGKIFNKLRGEADRQRTSLYLSRTILDEFREACNGVPPSRVMEELMKEFISSARDGKPLANKKKRKKS